MHKYIRAFLPLQSEQMHNDGFIDMVSIDYSEVVIERMRSKLSEKKLKRFNELPENYRYKAGQLVYLEKKQKIYTGKEKFHIVSKGQTLYNIAQNYGLRYKSIIKLNKIYKDKKPAIGTAIRLQKEDK